MDYSSLAEGQQQQQQHQPDQQQAYDPSQAQAYAAYYAAYEQYYGAPAYYHQPYYAHDYSSSSTAHAAAGSGVYYTEAQPDSAAPPSDATQIHHSGAHGASYAPATEQGGYSYQAPAGLNPAAVAALTQLSQLSGSIDAAERAMAGMHDRQQQSYYQQYPHPMAMQHGASSIRPGVGGITHRGGGRRGGGPLRGRGGNRGRIGQHTSGRGGGGPPPSRGRGLGRMSRARGRRSQHFAPDSQHRHTAIATSSEPSISAAAQAQGLPLSTPKAPQRSLLPVAWCDICRVDCNSLEILEQHKNGKRHKRTVQRVQEIQAQQKVITAELQFNAAAKPEISMQGEDGYNATNDGRGSTNATNIAIPSSADGNEAGKALLASAHVGETKKDAALSGHEPAMEEAIKGFVASENNQQDMETGNQCQILEGQSEPVSDITNTGSLLTDASQDGTSPIEGISKKRRMAGYNRNDRWRGSKQKMMRIGRGGRHFKSFERAQTRPFERPKDRPRDRPRVCTVCNVMCDTMAVFECHLSGKKHISRLKRFEGQGSVYGPISVYIPPNQPSTYPNKGPEPLFYGLQSHEALQQEAALRHGMLQQGAHVDDSQHMENHAADQCYQIEHFEEDEGVAPESEVKQSPGHPEVGPATDANGGEVVVMPDPDDQSTLNDPDVRETNKSAPDDADLMDATALPIVVDLPEYGTSVGAEVEPELDATREEPLANSEGLQ